MIKRKIVACLVAASLALVSLALVSPAIAADAVGKSPTRTRLAGYHSRAGTVYLTGRSSRWAARRQRWVGNNGHYVNFFVWRSGHWHYLGHKIMRQQNCCPEWGVGTLVLHHIPYRDKRSYIARTPPTRTTAGSSTRIHTG